MQQFDAAALAAVSEALVFADLRTACLQANDLECLLDSETEIRAAAERAVEGLESVGAAAGVAGGHNPDYCEGLTSATAEAVRSDIAGLQVYAESESSGAVSFNEAATLYNKGLTESENGQAGHEYATRLLVCGDSVKNTGETTDFLGALAQFLSDEITVRPWLSLKLWSQALCVDVGPVNGLPCVGIFDQTVDPSLALDYLGSSYEQLTGFDEYAQLPTDCQTAIGEAAARLQSSYDIYLDLRERELVSSDPELGSLMARGIYQIDERRRGGDGAQYPFNESMALRCAEAALSMPTS